MPPRAGDLRDRVSELEAVVSELRRQLERQTADLRRTTRELQDEMVRHDRTEEALRQERHLLQAFMDNVPDNIYFKDCESRFVRINKAAAKWYGLNGPGEAVGKTDFDLFTQEHAQPAFEDEQRVISTGQPLLHKEEKETWPDGRETWVDTSKLPLRDPDGEIIGTFGISRDITDRKLAEISLKAAKDAAETANRAKSAFLAHMSHEIRTPMAAVIGLAEVLLQSDLTSEQCEHARIILDSGESLLSIINDILDFSRIEAGRIELDKIPFDVRDLVRTMAKSLQISARRRKLELSWQIDDTVPAFLLGDPCRLRQVLVNLMGNAIKFTQEGSVRLHVTAADGPAEYIVLQAKVSDTGIGIPPERVTAIFDEFEQADKSTTRQFGGTGLGLAIAVRLVRLMDGTIDVHSEPGQGSEFSFTARFGQCDQPPKSAAEAGNYALEDLPKLHILLAEDNAFGQTVARELLERAGHRVTVVEDGERAVAACEQGKYDLVLMDVEMPKLDGVAATRAIRQSERDRGGHVPILAMTAHALAEDRRRCLDAGMDGYLSKPIRANRLTAAIRSVLGTQPATGSPTDPCDPWPATGNARQVQPEEADAAAASSTDVQAADNIDWQGVLAAVGGDTELLQLAVAAARTECPELMHGIRRALDQGDAKALRMTAHTLKGTLRHFGDTDVYETSYLLERAARDTDLPAARGVFENLQRQLPGFLNRLASFDDRR